MSCLTVKVKSQHTCQEKWRSQLQFSSSVQSTAPYPLQAGYFFILDTSTMVILEWKIWRNWTQRCQHLHEVKWALSSLVWTKYIWSSGLGWFASEARSLSGHLIGYSSPCEGSLHLLLRKPVRHWSVTLRGLQMSLSCVKGATPW